MASQKRWISSLCSSTIICFLFSNVITCVLAEKIKVLRFKTDMFGKATKAGCDPWCRNAKGFQGQHEALREYLCQCKCNNGMTFLIKDKKCYTGNVLKQQIGNGLYLFVGYNCQNCIAELDKPGNIELKKDVEDCKIENVTYLYGNSWRSTDRSHWSIHDDKNEKNQYIGWNTSLPDLKGKIIKIHLKNCAYGPNLNIFIKANGSYVFPPTSASQSILFSSSNVLSTITPSPSLLPTPYFTPSIVTTYISVTSSVHVTTSISITPNSVHVESSVNSPLTASATAMAPHPTREATSSKPRNKGKEKQSSSTGAIAGSVVGVVVIVAVIIIFVILCRKRRKPESRTADGVEKDSKSNPTYGRDNIILSPHAKTTRNDEVSDDELEYDYAAIDGDPRSHGNQESKETSPHDYQSLIKDPTKDSEYTALNREPGSPPDQTYTYNKMDRPLYDPQRKGPTDPPYNTLNRTNGNNQYSLEPGEQNSTKSPISKNDPPNNEPLYNTLEDPNQGGDKENGEQDVPEYNALEDPDNSYDYALVEGNTRPLSSCDNAGYKSTLGINRKAPPTDQEYTTLEGPSSEPSYQSLQIKAPDEVYQPLDRTSQNLEQPLYHVLEDRGNVNLNHA